jgi:phosphoribosylformimino-5-aminoimidazole carboxamide ribotide isomerase
MCFDVIPVLDIRHGQAVHAIAGRRADYRLLKSIMHPTSDPIELASALRDTLGLQALYVADLDAIEGGLPQHAIHRRLAGVVPQVWIDAGIRDLTSARPLLELKSAGVTIVAGLETIGGPQQLAAVLRCAGAEGVVFCLDLEDGHPRAGSPAAWATADPFALASEAIAQGVSRLLILDLSRVGTGRGTGTEDLLVRLRSAYSGVDVFVGGGISRIEEVARIRALGARGLLLGSALHDGRIGPRELARLAGSGSIGKWAGLAQGSAEP